MAKNVAVALGSIGPPRGYDQAAFPWARHSPEWLRVKMKSRCGERRSQEKNRYGQAAFPWARHSPKWLRVKSRCGERRSQGNTPL